MAGKKALILIAIIAVAAAGFVVGRISGDADVVPERVKRVFPSLPPPPSDDLPDSQPEARPTVIIETPAEGQIIRGSLDVAGRFLNDGRRLTVVLKDNDGQVISETATSVKTEPDSEYGRFKASVPAPDGYGQNLVLEVISRLSDGTRSGPDAVRVISLPPAEPKPVKLYFGNSEKDPFSSCTKVFPVTRKVVPDADGGLPLAAVKALLEGLTEAEKEGDYYSLIPEGVQVNSLTVDSRGYAKIDFSQEMDEGVAGSCRVSAIRSQVFSTLDQFREIKKVTISVEGDSEESLQP